MEKLSRYRVFVPNAEQAGASKQDQVLHATSKGGGAISAASTAVTAVGRLLDILDAFQRVQKPLSLTELAEITAIQTISGLAITKSVLSNISKPDSKYLLNRISI
jgi:hypothetical protein